MDRAQRQIDLIREYRTRLISDVVTGKLDVREAAAGLPEKPKFEALDEAEAQEGGEEESVEDLEAAPEEAEA